MVRALGDGYFKYSFRYFTVSSLFTAPQPGFKDRTGRLTRWMLAAWLVTPRRPARAADRTRSLVDEGRPHALLRTGIARLRRGTRPKIGR